MAFTNPEFPGRTFETFTEYEEAKQQRAHVTRDIEERSQTPVTTVTAVIIPASQSLLERKVSEMEENISNLERRILSSVRKPGEESIPEGTILCGESKGKSYTIESLEAGYLCSDGKIYQSLSGAALGVSGNRRSGWVFWKTEDGIPIGEKIGRLTAHGSSGSATSPFTQDPSVYRV
jgi:hypothetical protein